MAGERGLAEQIRTGLGEQHPQVQPAPATVDALDELWHRKPVRVHVREFGAVMALVALIISAFLLYRERHITVVVGLTAFACLFWGLTVFKTRLMIPTWRAWMKLAEGLGVIVTFVILTVVWGVMVIPTSVLLRIIGIKVMDLRFGVDTHSYWEARDPKKDDFQLLKRQF